MRKKFSAVLLIFFICLAMVPLMSGCKATANFTLNEAGDGYILDYSGMPSSMDGVLEIPAYYGEGEDRLPVVEIAERGLSGFYMSKVVIPATVVKIGAACFSYCGALEEVVFGDGSSLTSISQGAFGYCGSLKKINIPSGVTKIESMAFCECSALADVSLPYGLTEIGQRAFEKCYSLIAIEFPSSLTSVGDMAFYTSGLESVIIPDGVTQVGKAAFHSCTALKSATLGAGMQIVSSGVFGYCPALERLYIPASVVKIEGAITYDGGKVECGHAFHNAKALKDIYYGGSEAQWQTLKENTENTLIQINGVDYDNSAIFNASVHYNSYMQ